MAESVAAMADGGAWSGLLSATREALATLRPEDLEELVARAEQMLRATRGSEPGAETVPPPGAELARASRERRLLRDLLQATDSNLRVLRRLDGAVRGRDPAEGADPRWAR